MQRSNLSKTIAAAAVAVALVGGGSAHAGPIGQDMPLCWQQPPGHEGKPNPLCANGPAECVAYGLWLAVDPNSALPSGAGTSLAHSHAMAMGQGWYGFGMGQAHADAATARADVPGTLGEGTIESRCDAMSNGSMEAWFNYASGSAETQRLSLDLNSYGVPATLTADVLKEDGWSASGGAGTNGANIANVTLTTPYTGTIVVPASAAPNTSMALGTLGTLYLNEQSIAPTMFGCIGHSGDALRLVLNNPLGGQITLILSWVSTAAC